MSANWLEAHYGSRRGGVTKSWHRMLYRASQYRKEEIPWQSIERLVFVCKGNVCRSAFAEVVARSNGISLMSVGVHAIDNAPANKQAIIAAKKMCYDLSGHRITTTSSSILKKTDLFVAMKPWQAQVVVHDLVESYHTIPPGLWDKRDIFENITAQAYRLYYFVSENLSKTSFPVSTKTSPIHYTKPYLINYSSVVRDTHLNIFFRFKNPLLS